MYDNQVMLRRLFKIEDNSKKESLLGILADQNCRVILDSITDNSKSVIEIAKDTGICASTVYRKIILLSDNKLLRTFGSFSEDGKKSFFYKSRVKSINVFFDIDSMNVEITYK